jgi:hypothetical protein
MRVLPAFIRRAPGAWFSDVRIACQRCRSLNDGRDLRRSELPGSRSEPHLEIGAAPYVIKSRRLLHLATFNFRRRHRDYCHRARCHGAPCCVRLYANYLRESHAAQRPLPIYAARKKLASKITSRRQSCFNSGDCEDSNSLLRHAVVCTLIAKRLGLFSLCSIRRCIAQHCGARSASRERLYWRTL